MAKYSYEEKDMTLIIGQLEDTRSLNFSLKELTVLIDFLKTGKPEESKEPKE